MNRRDLIKSIPLVADVKVHDAKQADTIVVRCKRKLTMEEYEDIREQVLDVFSNTHVLVIGEDVDVSFINSKEHTASPGPRIPRWRDVPFPYCCQERGGPLTVRSGLMSKFELEVVGRTIDRKGPVHLVRVGHNTFGTAISRCY